MCFFQESVKLFKLTITVCSQILASLLFLNFIRVTQIHFCFGKNCLLLLILIIEQNNTIY